MAAIPEKYLDLVQQKKAPAAMPYIAGSRPRSLFIVSAAKPTLMRSR